MGCMLSLQVWGSREIHAEGHQGCVCWEVVTTGGKPLSLSVPLLRSKFWAKEVFVLWWKKQL